jgi:type VI secretion system secreted protein Hcp
MEDIYMRTVERSKFLALGVAALVGLCTAPSAEAAAVGSYFLKIPGIPGESVVDAHAGEIDVVAFSMNFRQPGICGELQIIKGIDKASPGLLLSTIQGQVHDEVTLTGRTSGEAAIDQFRLILRQARVLRLSLTDSAGTTPAAMETLVLRAPSIEIQYVPVAANGSPLAPVNAAISCRFGGSGG